AAHVSMTHPSSVRQYAEWAFLQNRIRFQPVFEAERLATIAAMVECGFGVAALPEIAAGTVRQPGIVERLLTAPVTERSIGLVTSRNRSLSPAAAELAAAVRAQLASAPVQGTADTVAGAPGTQPSGGVLGTGTRDRRHDADAKHDQAGNTDIDGREASRFHAPGNAGNQNQQADNV
ncbi:MAG: LysR substrate-binding domain-containing protein, partial [Cupriavidus necator]